MKTEKITIKKIYKTTKDTKYGPKDVFVLYSTDKRAFNGWGDGSQYKEGETAEITYDEGSVYTSKKDGTLYYKLITTRKKGGQISHDDIQRIIQLLTSINNSIANLKTQLSNNGEEVGYDNEE